MVDGPSIPFHKLASPPSGVEATYFLEVLTPHEKRAGIDKGMGPGMRLHPIFEFMQAIRTNELLHMREDHFTVGALETGNLQAKLIGDPDVIRIEKGQQRALCKLDPAIARRGRACPFLPNIVQSGVTELSRHLTSRICRAVIDHYDLEFADGLRSNTSQGISQIGLPVEHRYDYRQ